MQLGVSLAIIYCMPTKSYKWTPMDFASSTVIDKLLTSAGIGNREFDRRTDSAINYGRVRDIRNGLKAPIRLSEFLIICDVCGADPVQTLRDIIAEAERLKQERAIDEMADAISANPDDYDLAALDDPNKENESTTPRE